MNIQNLNPALEVAGQPALGKGRDVDPYSDSLLSSKAERVRNELRNWMPTLDS